MASRRLVSRQASDVLVCLAVVGLVWAAAPVAVAQPVTPDITLTKTVGTTPGVCAPTSTITVAAGTEVTYCYEVQNTGNIALNYHDLVDDQLGALLDEFPFALAPGASTFLLETATPLATVTNTATWTAFSSLAGYVVDDTIAYDFQDISTTGTVFTLPDDGVLSVPIGFSFEFFGTAYTSFFVSSNGFMSVADQGSGCCTGQALPDPTTPNGVIAGWWEDLDPAEAGSGLYYQTLGTAPNRVFIVQFSNVQHYPSGNAVTMQYKLFETSNDIEVHYQAAPSDGGTHSAGIENQDGTIGVQYFRGTTALPTPLAVRYSLAPVESASDTASATVTVEAPDIDVSPLALSSTQMPDTTAQRALSIGNTGTLPLNWNLVEEPVAEVRGSIPPGTAALSREGLDPSDLKPNRTFGAPGPQSDWAYPDAVLYDNGPLVTNPGGGAGGADVSALQTGIGMDTYGFGYQQSAGNRVADDFTITGGGWFIETITFFGYQTGSSTTSTFTAMNLRIWDGPPDNPASMVVFGDTTTNVMTSSVFSNIYRTLDTSLTATDRPIMANTVTVNTFLPTGTYWLDWQANGTLASGPWAPPITILGQTTTGNALQWTGSWAAAVDGGLFTPQGFPFVIEGSSDCSNPSDVPWLSAAPTGGTTAAGATTPVTVTFDSTGLALGTYEARLCITSDDPNTGPGNGTNLVIVPATMNVSPTAPSIAVTKTVGTDPAVCAATSSITVPAGSTVYYCYTVTNTGDVAFGLHDLDDDQLGNIFTGLAYVLAPGASVNTVAAGLTIPAVINVPTVNVATWTAYNDVPADGVQGQATASVQIEAAQAIPTLHGLGLLVLVVLLAGTGVLVLRRVV
jgi:hypothetical protein